ncbi:uncharacterized protein LOC144429927 [Styela clava]
MRRMIYPMLIALLVTQVNGVQKDVELRNRSGEITYSSTESGKHRIWKFPAKYRDNHTLFIFIKNVSMYGWISENKKNDTGCIGTLSLPELSRTCREPEVKCIYYLPFGCSLQTPTTFTIPDIDGVVCDKFAWFRLSKMPAELKITRKYSGEKFVQIQYKYLECPTNESEYSTTVTDSLQMVHGRTELIVGLAIAIGLLVISWVVLGVVIIRNRSKVTSRNPEESSSREIVVNAIYGDNFGRMGDDSQPSSSNAIYSVINRRRQAADTPPR